MYARNAIRSSRDVSVTSLRAVESRNSTSATANKKRSRAEMLCFLYISRLCIAIVSIPEIPGMKEEFRWKINV